MSRDRGDGVRRHGLSRVGVGSSSLVRVNGDARYGKDGGGWNGRKSKEASERVVDRGRNPRGEEVEVVIDGLRVWHETECVVVVGYEGRRVEREGGRGGREWWRVLGASAPVLVEPLPLAVAAWL